MNKFFRQHFLVILIIIVATFTRFYRLPATVTFLEDEGRDVLIENRLLSGDLIALGPQTSTGNMYLGPIYYYFTAPALYFAGGDPLGPIILIALSGVLTTYLLFRYVSSWFGVLPGASSALLYAVLPATVYMTRNSWNPNLVPLVSLLFIKIVTSLNPSKKSLTNFFLLGVLAGILVQLHYLVLVLLGVTGLYLAWLFRKSLLFFGKGVVLALLGFLLPLLPFILFEFKNDFVNTQAIVRFVRAQDDQNIRYQLPFRMYTDKVVESGTRLLTSLFGQGQVVRNDPLAPFFFWGFVGLTLLGLRRKHPVYILLMVLTFGSLGILGIYQENIHLHYLGFLFPPVLILVTSLLTDSRKMLKILTGIYLLISLFYGGYTTYRYVNSGPSSQLVRAREVATYIVKASAGKPYNAVTFRDTSTTSPFAYFLEISDNPPTEKLEEKLFLICVDRPCDQSDLDFAWLYRKGPAHPSLEDSLGHPFIEDFQTPLEFARMEHVSHGVWVGEVNVKLSL